MSTKSKPAARPPKSSPWGRVQWSKTLAPGIYVLTTASHGGVKLTAPWNRKIPKPFRLDGGWYEEDCDVAIPIYFLPDHFEARYRDGARRDLRNLWWKAWEEHFKEEVPLAESKKKSIHFWHEARKDKWISTTAWGDWCETVPAGMVGVAATRGGWSTWGHRPEGSRWVEPETTYWLMSKEEYATRFNNPAGAIVIDPDRHEPWSGPPEGDR